MKTFQRLSKTSASKIIMQIGLPLTSGTRIKKSYSSGSSSDIAKSRKLNQINWYFSIYKVKECNGLGQYLSTDTRQDSSLMLEEMESIKILHVDELTLDCFGRQIDNRNS